MRCISREKEALQRVVTRMCFSRLADVCSEIRVVQRRPQEPDGGRRYRIALAGASSGSRLQAAQPDVDVRISADNRVVDLEREGFDVALRYLGAGEAPADALLLFEEQVFPVAAPALAASLPKRVSAEDFSGRTARL